MLHPTPNVPNFLLIHYAHNPRLKDDPRLARQHQSGVVEHNFRFMVDQISRLYPKAFVHVLTDRKHPSAGRLVYHRDLSYEYPMIKVKIYGAVDEPAMYTDTDVVFHRPFTRQHLENPHHPPFNLYTLLKNHNAWTKNAVPPLPFPVKGRYNSGIAWIPQPDPHVERRLIDIKETYFPDPRMRDGFHVNDELLMTCYIEREGLKMNLVPEVNAGFREKVDRPQSTHYWGPDGKDRFSREVSRHAT